MGWSGLASVIRAELSRQGKHHTHRGQGWERAWNIPETTNHWFPGAEGEGELGVCSLTLGHEGAECGLHSPTWALLPGGRALEKRAPPLAKGPFPAPWKGCVGGTPQGCSCVHSSVERRL